MSRLAKLLRFALDPAAHPGEAENAARRFVEHARAAGLDVAGVAKALGATTATAKRKHFNPAAVRMHFGKYKGQTLGQIRADDPDYVLWLAAECELRGRLKRAVEELAEVAA